MGRVNQALDGLRASLGHRAYMLERLPFIFTDSRDQRSVKHAHKKTFLLGRIECDDLPDERLKVWVYQSRDSDELSFQARTLDGSFHTELTVQEVVAHVELHGAFSFVKSAGALEVLCQYYFLRAEVKKFHNVTLSPAKQELLISICHDYAPVQVGSHDAPRSYIVTLKFKSLPEFLVSRTTSDHSRRSNRLHSAAVDRTANLLLDDRLAIPLEDEDTVAMSTELNDTTQQQATSVFVERYQHLQNDMDTLDARLETLSQVAADAELAAKEARKAVEGVELDREELKMTMRFIWEDMSKQEAYELGCGENERKRKRVD